MSKEKVFIIMLGVVVGVVVIIGFTLVGSPFQQRKYSLDESRLSDFGQIESYLQSNYREQGLPANQVQFEAFFARMAPHINLQDPETGQTYTYETGQGNTSYGLCATFSASSEERRAFAQDFYSVYNGYTGDPRNHEKGYDCINYEIPSYLIPTATPTPISVLPVTPTVASPAPTLGMLLPPGSNAADN